MEGQKIVKKMVTNVLFVIILATVTATIGMLIDGIIIGHFLGADAMAAYGIVMPVFIVITAVGSCFSAGTQTRCASCMGMAKMDDANKVFSTSCLVALILSVVLAVVCYIFTDPILGLLGASGNDAELYAGASNYYWGILIGVPAILGVQTVECIMQLDGDKIRSMVSTLVMTIVNISLDILNVYVFKKGMFGMAMATTISYYVSLFILLFHFAKKNHFFKLSLRLIDIKDFISTVSIGLPTTIGRACTTFRTIFMNRIILAIATSAAVGALAIQNNLNTLFGCVGTGVSMVTLMITGIFLGEEDISSLKNLLKISIKYAVILMGASAIIIFIFAGVVVKAYTHPGTETYELAVSAVRFYALCMPLYGINNVFMKYLQGIKKIFFTNVLGILDNFLFVVLLAFALGKSMGLTGVWLSFVLCEVLSLIFLVIASVYYTHRVPKGIDDFLFLPRNIGCNSENMLEFSIQNDCILGELVPVIEDFCLSKTNDSAKATRLAVCAEELISNALEHGFKDNKKHSVYIKVFYKDQTLTLRYRDDCSLFNPEKFAEVNLSEDKEKNIGIRLLKGMSKEFTYLNVLNMNTLIVKV